MFTVGEEINRRKAIHEVYAGQQYGGISTPKGTDAIFLFTSDKGEAFGYSDKPQSDGTFWYTGEGQLGDMSFIKSNKAIRDHKKTGKKLYLFESTRDAYVRLLGEAEYIGHHIEQRPDRTGSLRDAIVFHLYLGSNATPTGGDFEDLPIYNSQNRISLRNRTLNELRQLATQVNPNKTTIVQAQREAYVRSEAIKIYVLRRADGVCECCGKSAPFETNNGPYLECHHILRLSDGGPDIPENVVGICPNCHREAHYGTQKDEVNIQLKAVAQELESL